MSSYLTNSSVFQTKFPTHHAVRLGQQHFVNENWTRGRASHALSIQINVFFSMSVIQKRNEYTHNPCKHNVSRSQFRTGQLKLNFVWAKHVFKHENNVQTFDVRKLFNDIVLRI